MYETSETGDKPSEVSPVLLRWSMLVLFAAVGLGALPATGLVLWAETWQGRLVGVSSLALVALPLALARLSSSRSTRNAVLAGGLAAVGLGGAAITLGLAPSGRSTPGAKITSVILGQTPSPSLLRAIPEIDQVAVGVRVIPLLDPIIDRRAAQRLADITLPIYREMEADPAVVELGSVMPHAYANLFGERDDSGHLYQVLPAQTSSSTEALIFLHGSAGNFKSYAWVLAELAARRGMIVVCPSFGFGEWSHQGGLEAVERARDYVVRQLHVDPTKITLAGLSNGGVGVSLAAAHHPEWYRGLILISPVMDSRSLQSAAFQAGWRGRPVLVLEGELDDRVEEAYVSATVGMLRKAGVEVRYEIFRGEDHFLFYAERRRALELMAEWMSPERGGPR